MGKRILITGGSHAEIPLIRAARLRGDYVITTGNDAGGLGHKESDEYAPGDYSDKEYVLSLAKEYNVDAIVSGCNDFAYLSTAYACEKLGFRGHDSYETALVIHRKDQFRKMTQQLGIRTPRACSCTNLEEVIECCKQIGFPVLIKPVDLTGGKGVLVCETEEAVVEAYHSAMQVTRQPIVIVEEYIRGTNHGASVLLKAGKVVFGFVDNEQYYLNPYLVAGACFPSSVPHSAILQLYKDIEKIATHLKLVDGLFHTQFMVEKENVPVMIDPCRRAPGDLYISLVQYATEVNYPLEILKAECGETLADSYSAKYHNVARECIMTDQCGVVEKVLINSELENQLIDKMLWAKSGDVIEDFMKYKAGILFFGCEDQQQFYKEVECFQELVSIQLQ